MQREVTPMTPAVDVQVTPLTGPEPKLRVRVTNTSDTALDAYEASLPWRTVYSMILVAVSTDPAGTVLERSLPIDDPGPGTITLRPGQALEGDVALERRFPGFVQAQAARDVLVFWSYRFQPIGRPALPWRGGFVVFPRVEG